eukprot:1362523-Pyramimonas_sp.AAC.2
MGTYSSTAKTRKGVILEHERPYLTLVEQVYRLYLLRSPRSGRAICLKSLIHPMEQDVCA